MKLDGDPVAKVNFTAARVEAHHCASGQLTKSGQPVDQAFIWDGKASGLGLRATAAGAKTYIFQGKLHGRTIRVTIGDPRDWDIDQAQEEARRLQRLLDAGIDPRADRAEKRAAFDADQLERRRRSATVADAWKSYIEVLRTKISPTTKKPRSPRYIQAHIEVAAPGGELRRRSKKKTIAGPLAPLMKVALGDLTPVMVGELFEREAQVRPTASASAYRMWRAFLRWCDAQDEYKGTVTTDCWASSKITDVIPKVATKDDDCLQKEQLSAWFSGVQQLSNYVFSGYLIGLLLTGARREELIELRWTDVDFRWRTLRIADKMEGSRVIPLTPYFASILVELKRLSEIPPSERRMKSLTARGEKWVPSPWVFFSKTSRSGRITQPTEPHARALAAAGIPHVTIHGLRRSFGTLAEWVDVPLGVAAQIQGHKPSALAEKHYRRRPIDMLRQWHDKIESWFLEQAAVPFEPPAALNLRVVNGGN
ncbi:putative phage integrase [Burkholderia lata]|uniref:tyrosine-type recombinase/integrase n=1 Tax=Burkholderia lata (strain ATCC 17760 / DSM 23089 / LMG 22485 / NCIMB 9086 / R18194 / 383) TaxID=482957 RepID=UPI001454362B|nr:integrase family protein [Burkholderia lata]VWC40725.1 putative phage integrase [Burkholderia lata]